MSAEPVAFDDLPTLKGRTIIGEPFTVTAEDQERFDVATWIDRAYAGPEVPEFPDNIIEGFYLLSLVDAVAVFNTPGDRNAYWGLNYGLDRVRFVSPLWLGTPIIPTFEYLDVKPKDEGYLMLRRVTFSHEDSERPGMVADWWGFVQRRGETGT